MDDDLKQRSRLIWVGLGLTCALLALGVAATLIRLKASRQPPLPVLGTVADFSLTNQNGQVVSVSDLRGHPWVADIIFTRCAGPCPRMTRQMADLQAALPASSSVRLVTLTTDPEFDTPPVLLNYARKFGADTNRWIFLTGTKTQIAAAAVDSLKLVALEKKPGERQDPADLFIHSTIFVVVDAHSQLRGIYETTGDGIDPAATRERILTDLARLEREP